MRPASKWATREYLNLSAGLAGDDRRRGKHWRSLLLLQLLLLVLLLLLHGVASPDFVRAHGLSDQDPKQSAGILLWSSVPGICSGAGPWGTGP